MSASIGFNRTQNYHLLCNQSFIVCSRVSEYECVRVDVCLCMRGNLCMCAFACSCVGRTRHKLLLQRYHRFITVNIAGTRGTSRSSRGTRTNRKIICPSICPYDRPSDSVFFPSVCISFYISVHLSFHRCVCPSVCVPD